MDFKTNVADWIMRMWIELNDGWFQTHVDAFVTVFKGNSTSGEIMLFGIMQTFLMAGIFHKCKRAVWLMLGNIWIAASGFYDLLLCTSLGCGRIESAFKCGRVVKSLKWFAMKCWALCCQLFLYGAPLMQLMRLMQHVAINHYHH